jgi:hypothetical protein
MNPTIITLAQAGQAATAAPVRIVPLVSVPLARTMAPLRPVSIPSTAQTSAGAYFGLFRSCDCGHSSAWHSGAFGDAWRAGEQVHGRCEAAPDEDSTFSCRCARFREPDLAS